MANRNTKVKSPGPAKGSAPRDDSAKEETSLPGEDPRFDVFLRKFARYPHKAEALKAAGIEPEELLQKMRDDSDFARKYMEADELGVDVLEDAAVERAVRGWDEPVFDMKRGIEVGSVRKYSDTMLTLLLKGRRKKYRGDDQTGGRGVSEEARREMKELFDSVAPALVLAEQNEVTPVSVSVEKSRR